MGTISVHRLMRLFYRAVISLEEHAFLDAYYLKNENQGKEPCTPFHY